MADIQILVVANHPEILETIIRLINKNEDWNGTGVANEAAAREAFELNKFDLVLLGAGVDAGAASEIRQLCHSGDPQIICVQHFGGGSGLLHSEIQHALTRNTN